MEQRDRKNGQGPRIWVPIVILVGLVAGIALAVVAPLPSPMGPGSRFRFQFETAEDVRVILWTISVALLIALVWTYVRTYADTKASFAVGLVVVLVALLVETAFTSPFLFGAFGLPPGGLGAFLLIAEVFKVAAFAVFLYLSLQ